MLSLPSYVLLSWFQAALLKCGEKGYCRSQMRPSGEAIVTNGSQSELFQRVGLHRVDSKSRILVTLLTFASVSQLPNSSLLSKGALNLIRGSSRRC